VIARKSILDEFGLYNLDNFFSWII